MDMFETTAEVEAMCVRLATYRITPAERSHLQGLHEELAAMVAASDLDAYDEFNRVFHEAIYRSDPQPVHGGTGDRHPVPPLGFPAHPATPR